MSGRVLLVAEVGPNHNGDVEMALEIIRRLDGSGVDAIKFQLATPEAVYSRDAYKADYQKRNDGSGSVIEMSRRVQLSRDEHIVLYEACRAIGARYACTAFDLASLQFLDRTFDLPFFKVASGELLSIDMLEYMAARDRPILLSTGMATYDEIGSALGVLDHGGATDVTLLHCVSAYPARGEDINLRVIPELARRFGRPVGYSDHSLGAECCLGAVALGAVAIEKHVTLDKDLPGPDHKASTTVTEFAELAASIRRLDAALGTTEKVFSETEDAIRRMARKSIVARRDIAPGETITAGDITFKRPGTGVAPVDRDRVVGRRAIRAIDADRVVRLEDLGPVTARKAD